MIFKNRKKGQAAIEFLMTYGWMLLVVLIVGALIFSFVDFGSLLPNKIDLSNNLRGDPTGSLATADDDLIQVVFRYNGKKRVQIDYNNSFIKNDIGEICNATELKNLDTTKESTLTETKIGFLNGQDGLIKFDCRPNVDLIEGDSLVGTISIMVQDPKSEIDIPSKGAIRLQIN